MITPPADAPAASAKLLLEGVAESCGAACGSTVTVTGTTTGIAPAVIIVMAPLSAPGVVRVAVFTATANVPGVDTLTGKRMLNQLPLETAAENAVPEGVLNIDTVCAAGAASPTR